MTHVTHRRQCGRGGREGKGCGITLSTDAAGSEDVERTRDSELTDVSPELLGSTAPNDC
jgi:hypothetical protein